MSTNTSPAPNICYSVPFAKRLISLVRGLTGDYKLNVRVTQRSSTDLAYSSKDTIFIAPYSIRLPSDLTTETRLATAIGLTLHECAHILFTDFQKIHREEQQNSPKHHALFHKILNILEDARIERLVAYLFPGISYSLDVMNETLFGDKELTSENNPTYITDYMLYYLVYGKAPQIDSDFEQIWSYIEPFATTARKSDNFDACYDCATVICDILSRCMPAEDVAKMENHVGATNLFTEGTNRQSTPQPVDSNHFDNRTVQKPSQYNSDTENQTPSKELSSNSSESAESSFSEPSNQRGQDQDGGDNQDVVKDLIQDIIKDCEREAQTVKEDEQRVRDNLNTKSLLLQYHKDYTCYNDYEQRKIKLNPVINQMIKIFERMLNDNQDELIRYTHSGKIDGKSLTRILTGNVCAQRKERSDESELNITLLLDLSGSMRGQVSSLQDACILFAETCRHFKIPLSIIGFDGSHLQVFMHYKEKCPHSRYSIVTMRADGGTPLDKALTALNKHFDKIPHEDKLLLCINDGRPNDEIKSQVALKALQKDVIVYGCGIKCDLSHLFEHFISIQSVKELPKEMEIILRKHILK